MLIEVCNICGGTKTNFQPPKDFYTSMGKYPSHAPFFLKCKGCDGTGITNASKLKGKKEILFIRYSEGIFGNVETKIKISKKADKAWDVWHEEKGKMVKLTRGNKYLPAEDLAEAVSELLSGTEYRGPGKAKVLRLS